jgi:TolA-binding protein
MNEEVPGSYSAEELAALPGFSMTTLVCPAQGEIAEKNWRRAGEFSDIAAAITARENAAPPPAPASAATTAAAASASADVDAMIDTASTKLFSHVADLMKELENRRDDKSLITSLQRQIAALKEELSQTRERANLLEMRLPRLAELEEANRKNVASIESLQTSLMTREQSLNEARISLERNKNEADSSKRRMQEAVNDLAVRNRLVDKLSKELSEKELSLVKSLGVIRRLEEDLNRLCPDPALIASLTAAVAKAIPRPQPVNAPPPSPYAPNASEPPALTGPAIPPAPERQAPVPESRAEPAAQAAYTLDEPPPTPPYLEAMPPSERPKAQQALVNFIKRIFPGQAH